MRLCDLTLPTPQENLACDEALLACCEAEEEGNILRFWHSNRYFVALGYANRASTEVNLAFCVQNSIPVLRRCTGGGTVLQGPGCLNYSLILCCDERTELGSIPATNEYILGRHQQGLGALVGGRVDKQGQTDLAIGGLKFSGNAQRRGKRCLLFHGSFLLHMDFDLIEKALPMPSRQPEYRLNRSHADFLMNLKVPEGGIKAALCKAWGADSAMEAIPFDQIGALVRDKYGRDGWNLKF